MSASARIPVPNRRARMAILAGWLTLGFIESAKMMVMQRLTGLRPSWSDALAGNMPYWFFWALLTPLVFVLFRTFPLDRGRRLRNLAVHAGACLVVPFLHLWVTGVLYFYTTTRNAFFIDVPGPMAQVRNMVGGYIVVEILFYWAVVGVFYVLEFYRRYRDEELASARLAARTAQLEASMHEARLEALRMELNPHFLFNTLNAIAGLVRRRENDAAVGMLARLGDLLRTTLDRGGAQEITLHEELGLLERYLEIERIRFHDRLAVQVDVPDELRAALVPTLVLQPLVENAVRHGIAQRPGPGAIRIAAAATDGQLTLTVTDTGVGLPGEREAREGVGLSNTRARLAQLHGDAAALTLGPAEGGGAVATLNLPLHLAEIEEAFHAVAV